MHCFKELLLLRKLIMKTIRKNDSMKARAIICKTVFCHYYDFNFNYRIFMYVNNFTNIFQKVINCFARVEK